MEDYKKMYAVLCVAVDSVIDELDRIPLASHACHILKTALLEAEKIYIEADCQAPQDACCEWDSSHG